MQGLGRLWDRITQFRFNVDLVTPVDRGEDPFNFDFAVTEGSTYSIPYPAIDKEFIDKMKNDFVLWKEEFQAWRTNTEDKLVAFKEQVTTFCADVQINDDADPKAEKCRKLKVYIEDIETFLETDAEAIIAKIERNMEIIEGYYENLTQPIEEFGDYFTELPDQVKAFSEGVKEYFMGWVDQTKTSIVAWAEFRLNLKKMIIALQTIPQYFSDFTEDCPQCSVNRGTLEELTLRLLLQPILDDFIDKMLDKIMELLPNIPDVVIDLSGLSLGTEVVIPKLEMTPVELDVSLFPSIWDDLEFPDVTLLDQDFVLDFTMPFTLDSIPDLPEAPVIDLELPNISLTIPELFIIPEPPEVPDVLTPLLDLLALFKPFYSILCLLKQGLLPIPEYQLKPYVEQLTNRTSLFEFDFTSLSLKGDGSDSSDDSSQDTIVFGISKNFMNFVLNGDSMAEALAEYSECSIKKISNSLVQKQTDDGTGDGSEECEYSPELM